MSLFKKMALSIVFVSTFGANANDMRDLFESRIFQLSVIDEDSLEEVMDVLVAEFDESLNNAYKQLLIFVNSECAYQLTIEWNEAFLARYNNPDDQAAQLAYEKIRTEIIERLREELKPFMDVLCAMFMRIKTINPLTYALLVENFDISFNEVIKPVIIACSQASQK